MLTVLIITSVLAVAFFIWKRQMSTTARYTKAKLGGHSFSFEVADTPGLRERGLSGRQNLPNGQGMLFVFPDPDQACFWMKDMQFDIDILWFDQDSKLVNIKQEAAPSSYPGTFCPSAPAKYVVEVAAGTVDRLHLKEGDTFSQP